MQGTFSYFCIRDQIRPKITKGIRCRKYCVVDGSAVESFQFTGDSFTNFLAGRGIKQAFVSPTTRHKAYIAERQIRTLRNGLGRMKSAAIYQSDLPAMLHQLETGWNSRHVNAKTGLTPNETTNEMAPKLIFGRQIEMIRRRLGGRKRHFAVGDTVLIRKRPGVFTKSDESRFYSTLYRVSGVKKVAPYDRYYLVNSLNGNPAGGSFASAQITRVSDESVKLQDKKPDTTRSKAPSPVSTRTRSKMIHASPMLTRSQVASHL